MKSEIWSTVEVGSEGRLTLYTETKRWRDWRWLWLKTKCLNEPRGWHLILPNGEEVTG